MQVYVISLGLLPLVLAQSGFPIGWQPAVTVGVDGSNSITDGTTNQTAVYECQVCKCFAQYLQRDTRFPLLPYAEVYNPTREECLTWCVSEGSKCKAVVYGIIGGKIGVTCELYAASGLSKDIYSVYFMDYYDRMECSMQPQNPFRDEPDRMHVPSTDKVKYRKIFYDRIQPYRLGRH